MFHVVYIISAGVKWTAQPPLLFNFLAPTGEILKIYSSLWIIQMRFLMGKQQCLPAFYLLVGSCWPHCFHLSFFFFRIPSLSPSFRLTPSHRFLQAKSFPSLFLCFSIQRFISFTLRVSCIYSPSVTNIRQSKSSITKFGEKTLPTRHKVLSCDRTRYDLSVKTAGA